MISDATEHSTIDPLTLIKRLCQKKSSVVLLVQDGPRRGEVHLDRGRIVRASSGTLNGEQALFGMLMWPSPRTWLAPLFERPEINVFSDLSFLSEVEGLRVSTCAGA